MVLVNNNKNILLTGLPGCGKTTAVMRIIRSLKAIRIAGFYTQEIREGTKRVGFRWHSLEGGEGVLAHTKTGGRYRVGRYGVNSSEFENKVVPLLRPVRNDIDLFVVDEIGKMECFSTMFIQSVRGLILSEKKLLATVAFKGEGFIDEVKKSDRVTVFELTQHGFNQTVTDILEILSAGVKR